MLIDTHCHVDRYKNPLQVVRDCERNKVLAIGVTNLPSHYLIGRQHVSDNIFFKLAIGFHPMAIDKTQHATELRLFKSHASQCVYVGEIGLDFSKKTAKDRDVQMEVFTEMLRSIRHEKRFVTIHSRGAETETLRILTEEGFYPTVFHWYTGAISLIEQIIAKGHFFSVNPKMLQSEKGKTLLATVPKHRILTETDGPYVKIEKRPILPEDVSLVIKNLAGIWKITEAEVQEQIQDNFAQLLKSS